MRIAFGWFFVAEFFVGVCLGFVAQLGAIEIERGSVPDALRVAGYIGLAGLFAVGGPGWACALALGLASVGLVVGLIAGSVGLTTIMGVNTAALLALMVSRRTAAPSDHRVG